MLHAAETCTMMVVTMNHLLRNNYAMIWNCNIKARNDVSSDSLLSLLCMKDMDVLLRISRIRCFWHIERNTCWMAEIRKLNVVTWKRSDTPKKTR